MPAPVVYVLAIVGTVGAALAFKEFVYEPHIAPAIDRWKLEYRAARDARRRRLAMEVSQDGSDLLMSETGKKSKDESSSSDDDDSDDEAHGKAATTSTSHNFMRDGLLIRRSTLVTKSQLDIELDNFAAHEVNQWRSEATDQVLRQRKNVSEHAMDESIHNIPYTPLSPERTAHVVFDASASSPSPPSSHTQLSSPSPQTAPAPSTGVTPPGLHFGSKSEMPASLASVLQGPNPPVRIDERAASLHSPIISPVPPSPSSPPEVTPFQHMGTQSTLLGNTSQLSPTFNVPSTTPAQSLQQSYHQIIPSLSQSYPQDLDYEHDLELLSPPSSRADSPFSLAALSPDQRASNRSLSGLSSAISSPFPLRMNLGNQSYEAISPIPQIQLITPNDNMSTTNSVRSTAYLSFGEDSSDDGMDNELAQPYANLGASIGAEGTSGPTSAHEAQAQLHYHQPTALHPSLIHGPYHSNASPPYTSRLIGLPDAPMAANAPALDRAGSDATLASIHPEGQGLGLFPVPARAPRTPALAPTPPSAQTPNAAVAIGAGARDPSYFRASASASASPFVSAPASAVGSPAVTASSYLTAYQSEASSSGVDVSAGAGAGAGGQTPAMHSDSDLSDLDFMSDYQPSEPSEVGSEVSDLGEVSDESWSVASGRGSRAGGSDAGVMGRRGDGRATQGGRLWGA